MPFSVVVFVVCVVHCEVWLGTIGQVERGDEPFLGRHSPLSRRHASQKGRRQEQGPLPPSLRHGD